MNEPLVTCPTCGIPNFSPRGLLTHICKGALKNMKNVTPGKTADTTALATPPAQLFNRARELNQAAQLLGRMSVAMMIMCGVELARIKKELGFTHGGDRKSNPQRADLIGSWGDLCRDHVGISDDTANRYTNLAMVCGKKVRGIESLMTEDPNKFDQDKRDRITKAVAKAVDGHTATEILREWGVAKLDPVKASLDARAARENDPHADIRNEDGEIDDEKLAKKDAVAIARSYWTETCKTLLVQGKNNKSWRHLNDDELDAIRRVLNTVLKELT